jgi:hypothetical protein
LRVVLGSSLVAARGDTLLVFLAANLPRHVATHQRVERRLFGDLSEMVDVHQPSYYR